MAVDSTTVTVTAPAGDTAALSQRINDSVTYLVLPFSTPTNGGERLVSFLRDRRVDSEELRGVPDQDFSIPFYSFSEYVVEGPGKYLVTQYTEAVRDTAEVLDAQGHFKEGFDMENVALRTDTLRLRVQVRGDGRLQRDTVR